MACDGRRPDRRSAAANLETFSKAAELNSFTGEAKAMGMSQAAVSQRVQALEKTLNTPLFKRQGGRVLLTPAGQTLYDYAAANSRVVPSGAAISPAIRPRWLGSC